MLMNPQDQGRSAEDIYAFINRSSDNLNVNGSVSNAPPHSTHIRCGTELNRPSQHCERPARPIRTRCGHYTHTSSAWSRGQRLKPGYLDIVLLGLHRTNAYEKRKDMQHLMFND